MKTLLRNTDVISISLSKRVASELERERKFRGQSRSAFISSLIEERLENARWERIYKLGAKTARRFKITSEDDIDKIIHEE